MGSARPLDWEIHCQFADHDASSGQWKIPWHPLSTSPRQL